jgi:hypothetical protein
LESTSPTTGNLRTLLDNPKFTLDKIPDYPKFEYLYAKGGEKTFDIADDIVFGDHRQIIPFEREAEPGEILRDVDLRYRVDVSDNLLYRGKIRDDSENNQIYQEILMDYCSSDILFFINVFCWTFAPGKPPLPFILYDFQEDILTWFLWLIKWRLSGAVEKSRDLGLSWLAIALFAYVLCFCDNAVAYLFSMTEAEVDSKNEDSLFGKLRMLLENLPPWMTGNWVRGGYDDAKERIDKLLEIRFPSTNSRISGKLTGGQGGRSGRALVSVYDEQAFIENAGEVLAASAGLSPTDIYVSTVNGMGNAFAEITHREGTLKKSPHWSQHPLKNDKWAILERSKPKYTEERWNQEHEIDYQGSTSGRVYPTFISAKRKRLTSKETWCHMQEDWFFDYDPDYDVYVGLDFGISDPNSVIYMQRKPVPPEFSHKTPYSDIYIIFDEDENRDQTDDELALMLNNKGYKFIDLVGDLRSANRRNSDGKTLAMNLRKHGLHIVGKRNTEDAPIKTVRRRLSYPASIAFYRHGCPKLIESVQNWAFPTDKNTGLPLAGSSPKHDKYSHLNKALAYLIDWMDMGKEVERIKKKKPLKKWGFNEFRKYNI